MLRDLLSNRLIQAGLAFFVIVVGGSLLYSWHTQRTVEKAVGQDTRFSQGLQEQNATRPAEKANPPTPNEIVNAPDGNPEASMPEETEALPNEDETLDIADALLPDDSLSEETPAEEGPVSPFGFGPYPEIPIDYPHLSSWDQLAGEDDPEWELMARVMIKLWTQGKRATAASIENGLVYPTFTNTVYIKWDEYEGPNGPVRYISSVTGDPAAAMQLDAIRDSRDRDESLSEDDLSSHITFIPYDEGGINPYTFFDLPEKQ